MNRKNIEHNGMHEILKENMRTYSIMMQTQREIKKVKNKEHA